MRLQVEDQRYIFNRISSPTRSLQLILKAKAKYTSRHASENFLPPPPPPSSDKSNNYDLFVEALGEVMEEYMKKKNG